MSDQSPASDTGGAATPLRVAVPPYLEVRPLVSGLGERADAELSWGIPSRLGKRLLSGRADVVLLAASDLQRLDAPLKIIPAGCVASGGRCLSTRIFSQVPPEEVETLYVDIGSRTSVLLARLLWAESFRRRLTVIPYDPTDQLPPDNAQAVLLIGDKPVNCPPMGFDRQFDLASMWFQMTGLPFVFGVWATTGQADSQGLFDVLSEARRHGAAQLERIAREYAFAHQWPEDLALRHLTVDVQYVFGAEQREGLEEFFQRAEDLALFDHVRPVRYFQP